jgi:hypothetical protein
VSMPTGLIGHMDSLDVNAYGSVVDYLLENTPQLMHPESVRTFARMRHDPQLAAILQAYGGPIGRANWVVDGTGCRDEVTARIADELGLPVNGADDEPTGARRRKFSVGEHVRLVGLYRVFGHMFFEQAWVERDGGWSLDVVQERMPQTVAALHLNGDGTLQSVEQSGFANGRTAPKITTADHRLVYYSREREGSNYFGQSLLRASYGPWLIKDQMLRVHATSIRRFGMGVPTFEPIPGASIQPQQQLEADRVIARLRASENSHVNPPPGYRYVLAGMTGSVPDALGFITYLDRQMTRSTLTSLLDMATAERGARSLGETVMDLMVIAQQADARFIADTATQQLVIPLVDANWTEDEPAPRVLATDVGADVELTAQDLNFLLEYGGIRADKPARDWIRERYGMPDEDPSDPVYALPDPTTPSNQAPTQGGL